MSGLHEGHNRVIIRKCNGVSCRGQRLVGRSARPQFRQYELQYGPSVRVREADPGPIDVRSAAHISPARFHNRPPSCDSECRGYRRASSADRSNRYSPAIPPLRPTETELMKSGRTSWPIPSSAAKHCDRSSCGCCSRLSFSGLIGRDWLCSKGRDTRRGMQSFDSR